MSRPVDVSLLVPAKDEAKTPPEFLRLGPESLGPAPFSFEVVVVNDGSRDGSAELLERLQGEHRFLRVVTHRRQQGIADALRSASDVAGGDVPGFSPVRLHSPPAARPGL